MSQVLGGAAQPRWQGLVCRCGRVDRVQVDTLDPEGTEHRHHVVAGGQLRGRDGDGTVGRPQMDAPLACRLANRLGIRDRHPDRVEERRRRGRETGLGQRLGHQRRVAMDTLRNLREPVRPVVDGVHRSRDREQHLGGTDVRGGLVPTDVLLARLQRQPVRRAARRVDGHADKPAGEVPLQALPHGHVPGVRPAVEQRHPEPLGGPEHDVGAHRPG
jgi:hypothetical protein